MTVAQPDEQTAPGQDQVALIKQLQAALAARQQQQPAEAPAPTFNPEEQRQFARFGLDPERLRFMQTLSNLRRGLNMERGLASRAMQGALTPASGGVLGEEELAQFA